ncbi:dephospho-CoA kinase [Cellulophaga baltica]|uniref:dephospho-CoA kinase n=1 Tax=Cellulophaga TaxID=104264 RepID=UPI001C07224F|nr:MULTISPECIES: dephospho-CoA kinase [Cellulophaga]MBU2996039.1 dephospho-CoA kinase [Cellulophaga baltica]MDO6767434.1 dephospho-CoA kinase [Cellulophaga sp. 1_MG-2023]
MIVGLTGGIGSGKSTVAKMFAALNVPVYNSDREAKYLMVNSKPLRKEIQALLGKEAYIKKKLNRKYIASKVFANPELLAKLNAIVHPAVREHFLAWVLKQNTPYVLQETAVIFENMSQDNYDAIVLVTAPEFTRIERVISRDEMTEEKVRERINNQMSDSETTKLSDYVIVNLDLKETSEKVKEIHKQLLKKAFLID